MTERDPKAGLPDPRPAREDETFPERLPDDDPDVGILAVVVVGVVALLGLILAAVVIPNIFSLLSRITL